MSSYDYRTTIVRLSYNVVRYTYDFASHHAIIVKSYVIVRLSFNCRTMSYDLPTISQTLSMRRKPIVSSVTTKLRLQYRSRVGENIRNLRCHPSHDVAAQYIYVTFHGIRVPGKCFIIDVIFVPLGHIRMWRVRLSWESRVTCSRVPYGAPLRERR